MNSKIVAIAAILLMLAAAVSAAVWTQAADAESVSDFELGEKTITLTPDGKGSMLYSVSEAEYIPIGYTITWYIAQDTGTGENHAAEFTDSSSLGSRTVAAGTSLEGVGEFSEASEVIIGQYSFGMVSLSNVGSYLLTIDSTSGSGGNFILKCVVVVDTDSNPEGSDITLSYYGSLSISESTVSVTQLDEMDFSIGEPVFQKVSVTGGELPENVSWYAVSLPEGLSMSPSGIVSGMPTGKAAGGATEVSGPVKVQVFATSGTGADMRIAEYSLEITLTDPTAPGMTISMSSNSEYFKTISENSIYTAVQGTEDITLRINPDVEYASITVINDDGEQVQLDYSNIGGATIPAGGIGSYTIAVHAVIDSQSVSGSVILNVVSGMDSLEASIVVSGA